MQALLISEYFDGGVAQLATTNSIFGIGVIAGGLLLSVWGGFKRKIVTTMLGLIGLGLGVLAIGLAPANMFVIMLVATALLGVALPITNGSLSAVMMEQVAPDLQGRVFGTIGSMAGLMSPIGLLIAGPVSDRIRYPDLVHRCWDRLCFNGRFSVC